MERLAAYLKMAEGTGAFRTEEIEILAEVLRDALENPETTYVIREERVGGDAAGFIIFGRTPMTAFAWDLYWIVTEKALQGRGIGRKLLTAMRDHMLGEGEKAVVRVETSGRSGYNATREFYRKTGFTLLGGIPDFYEADDDLLIYYRVFTAGHRKGF